LIGSFKLQLSSSLLQAFIGSLTLLYMRCALACCLSGATARPIRQLQQQTVGLNYVPTGAGCELKTSVTAEKSHSHSWFNNGPVITGQVTLLNPKEYGIPVANVEVTAQSSDGQFYSGNADCGNGDSSTYVPTNPVPYTYGQVSHEDPIGAYGRDCGCSAVCTSSNSVGLAISAAVATLSEKTMQLNGLNNACMMCPEDGLVIVIGSWLPWLVPPMLLCKGMLCSQRDHMILAALPCRLYAPTASNWTTAFSALLHQTLAAAAATASQVSA
jgi:hypothetical protein